MLSKRDQEIEHGRKITRANMARGLVEALAKELPGSVSAELVEEGDPRQWIVVCHIHKNGETVRLEENFWDFPSNDLRATAMLIA